MSTKRYIKIGVIVVLLVSLLADPILAARRGSGAGKRTDIGSGYHLRSAPKRQSIIRPSPLRGVTRGNITTMYRTPRRGSRSSSIRTRSSFRHRYGLTNKGRNQYHRRYYRVRPYGRYYYRYGYPHRKYHYYYRKPHKRYYYGRPYRRYAFYYGWPYVRYYSYDYPYSTYYYHNYYYNYTEPDKPVRYNVIQTSVDRHLDIIAEAFANRDYNIAVRLAKKAVLDEPHSATLRFAYSQTLLADRQYRKAASALQEAMDRTDPHRDRIFYNVGLYPDTDVLDEHVAELRKQVEIVPSRADLQLLFAYELMSIGQFDWADYALEKARDDDAYRAAADKLTIFLKKLTKAPTLKDLKNHEKNDY